MEEEEIIYIVRGNVIDMLRDRGYEMDDNPNKEEFSVMYRNNEYDILNDKVLVYFIKDSKNVSKKDLETIVSKGVNYDKIIIISKEKCTPSVEKELMSQQYSHVELFIYQNLLMNISKHIYQPKFRVLSNEEVEEFLKSNKLKKTELPIIKKSDPIARYYGLRGGQVIKIIRQSPSAGEGIFYRRCQ